MKGARDKILPQMEKAKAEFLKDFEKNYALGMSGGQPNMRRNGQPQPPAAADPKAMKYMPLARSFMTRLFDVAEQAVRDADSATWGISITADGLKFTGLSEFTPATPSAQAVGRLQRHRSIHAQWPATGEVPVLRRHAIGRSAGGREIDQRFPHARPGGDHRGNGR